jgi:alpha-tubulin suppressor-like RCC1 family protein
MKWLTIGTVSVMALGACSSEAPPADKPDNFGYEGTGIQLSIAPLTLASVTDVCYAFAIENGDGQRVVSRGLAADETLATSVCSSQYGDGAGAMTFIAACDASTPTNSVTLWIDRICSDGAGINCKEKVAGKDYIDPCEDGCQLSADCVENADTPVVFNLTVLSPARQGFFDIAVNFEDVFCSAKLDTCYGGTPVYPDDAIELLFDEDGMRGHTAVAAVACTAGPGNDIDTTLYHSLFVVECGDPTTPTIYSLNISEASTPGNLARGTDPGAKLGTYSLGKDMVTGRVFRWSEFSTGDCDPAAGEVDNKKCIYNAPTTFDSLGAAIYFGATEQTTDAGLGPVEANVVYTNVAFLVPQGVPEGCSVSWTVVPTEGPPPLPPSSSNGVFRNMAAVRYLANVKEGRCDQYPFGSLPNAMFERTGGTVTAGDVAEWEAVPFDFKDVDLVSDDVEAEKTQEAVNEANEALQELIDNGEAPEDEEALKQLREEKEAELKRLKLEEYERAKKKDIIERYQVIRTSVQSAVGIGLIEVVKITSDDSGKLVAVDRANGNAKVDIETLRDRGRQPVIDMDEYTALEAVALNYKPHLYKFGPVLEDRGNASKPEAVAEKDLVGMLDAVAANPGMTFLKWPFYAFQSPADASGLGDSTPYFGADTAHTWMSTGAPHVFYGFQALRTGDLARDLYERDQFVLYGGPQNDEDLFKTLSESTLVVSRSMSGRDKYLETSGLGDGAVSWSLTILRDKQKAAPLYFADLGRTNAVVVDQFGKPTTELILGELGRKLEKSEPGAEFRLDGDLKTRDRVLAALRGSLRAPDPVQVAKLGVERDRVEVQKLLDEKKLSRLSMALGPFYFIPEETGTLTAYASDSGEVARKAPTNFAIYDPTVFGSTRNLQPPPSLKRSGQHELLLPMKMAASPVTELRVLGFGLDGLVPAEEADRLVVPEYANLSAMLKDVDIEVQFALSRGGLAKALTSSPGKSNSPSVASAAATFEVQATGNVAAVGAAAAASGQTLSMRVRIGPWMVTVDEFAAQMAGASSRAPAQRQFQKAIDFEGAKNILLSGLQGQGATAVNGSATAAVDFDRIVAILKGARAELGQGGFGPAWNLGKADLGDAAQLELAKFVERFFRFEGCGGKPCAFGTACIDAEKGLCEETASEMWVGENALCHAEGQEDDRASVTTMKAVNVPPTQTYNSEVTFRSAEDARRDVGSTGVTKADFEGTLLLQRPFVSEYEARASAVETVTVSAALDIGSSVTQLADIAITGLRVDKADPDVLVGKNASMHVIVRATIDPGTLKECKSDLDCMTPQTCVGYAYDAQADKETLGQCRMPNVVVSGPTNGKSKTHRFDAPGNHVFVLSLRWLDENDDPLAWSALASTEAYIESSVHILASPTESKESVVTWGTGPGQHLAALSEDGQPCALVRCFGACALGGEETDEDVSVGLVCASDDTQSGADVLMHVAASCPSEAESCRPEIAPIHLGASADGLVPVFSYLNRGVLSFNGQVVSDEDVPPELGAGLVAVRMSFHGGGEPEVVGLAAMHDDDADGYLWGVDAVVEGDDVYVAGAGTGTIQGKSYPDETPFIARLDLSAGGPAWFQAVAVPTTSAPSYPELLDLEAFGDGRFALAASQSATFSLGGFEVGAFLSDMQFASFQKDMAANLVKPILGDRFGVERDFWISTITTFDTDGEVLGSVPVGTELFEMLADGAGGLYVAFDAGAGRFGEHELTPEFNSDAGGDAVPAAHSAPEMGLAETASNGDTRALGRISPYQAAWMVRPYDRLADGQSLQVGALSAARDGLRVHFGYEVSVDTLKSVARELGAATTIELRVPDFGTGITMPAAQRFSGAVTISLNGPCACPDELASGICNPGSYDEDGNWTCNEGFSDTTAGVCADIDECANKVEPACSGSNVSCVNTVGSFECNCHPGFEFDKDKGKCADIDECAEGPNACVSGSSCDNVPGDYACNWPSDDEINKPKSCRPGTLALDDSGLKCETIQTVSAGSRHACALTKELGKVLCWGDNGYGQLGAYQAPDTGASEVDARARRPKFANLYEQVSVPLHVRLPGRAHLVVVSDALSCAVVGDNRELFCWGYRETNDRFAIHSYLGSLLQNATMENPAIPTRVDGLSGVKAFGMNPREVCAISGIDDAVTCQSFGGSSLAVKSYAEAGPDLSDLVDCDQIEVSSDGSKFARCGGDWYAWGSNWSGQLGVVDGDGEDVYQPTPIPGAWAQLESVGDMTCAVGNNGVAGVDDAGNPLVPVDGLYCWGWLPNAVEAVWSPLDAEVLTPDTGRTWKYFDVNGSSLCLSDSAGEVTCLGDSELVTAPGQDAYTPSAVPNLGGVGPLAITESVGFALKDGALLTWGRNATNRWVRMQAGLGDVPSAPVLVSNDQTWVSVSSGFGHQTCALAADGYLFCEGGATLGPDTKGWGTKIVSPTGGAWREFGVGSQHTCAIDDQAKIHCWGRDKWWGQLGGSPEMDGNGNYPMVDVLGGMSLLGSGQSRRASNLSVGANHACALIATVTRDENGAESSESQMHCWGYNGQGQLGNGNTSQAWTPTRVPHPQGGDLTNPRRFVRASASDRHSCFIDNQNDAWCAGDNGSGQLGAGVSGWYVTETTMVCLPPPMGCVPMPGVTVWRTYSTSPVRVVGANSPSLGSVIGVATAPYHSCFLRAGGALDCVGANSGIGREFGSYQYAATPIEVPFDVSDLVMRDSKACMVSTTGQLACMTSDEEYRGDVFGQGGLWKPVPAGDYSAWRSVTLGYDGLLAIADGALLSVGPQEGGDATPFTEPVVFACHVNGWGKNECYPPAHLACDTRTRLCKDRDECDEGDYTCADGGSLCANTLGKFECICPNGTSVDGACAYAEFYTPPTCVGADGVAADGACECSEAGATYRALALGCDQANECLWGEGPCGPGTCVDEAADEKSIGYSCECDTGYRFEDGKCAPNVMWTASNGLCEAEGYTMDPQSADDPALWVFVAATEVGNGRRLMLRHSKETDRYILSLGQGGAETHLWAWETSQIGLNGEPELLVDHAGATAHVILRLEAYPSEVAPTLALEDLRSDGAETRPYLHEFETGRYVFGFTTNWGESFDTLGDMAVDFYEFAAPADSKHDPYTVQTWRNEGQQLATLDPSGRLCVMVRCDRACLLAGEYISAGRTSVGLVCGSGGEMALESYRSNGRLMCTDLAPQGPCDKNIAESCGAGLTCTEVDGGATRCVPAEGDTQDLAATACNAKCGESFRWTGNWSGQEDFTRNAGCSDSAEYPIACDCLASDVKMEPLEVGQTDTGLAAVTAQYGQSKGAAVVFSGAGIGGEIELSESTLDPEVTGRIYVDRLRDGGLDFAAVDMRRPNEDSKSYLSEVDVVVGPAQVLFRAYGIGTIGGLTVADGAPLLGSVAFDMADSSPVGLAWLRSLRTESVEPELASPLALLSDSSVALGAYHAQSFELDGVRIGQAGSQHSVITFSVEDGTVLGSVSVGNKLYRLVGDRHGGAFVIFHAPDSMFGSTSIGPGSEEAFGRIYRSEALWMVRKPDGLEFHQVTPLKGQVRLDVSYHRNEKDEKEASGPIPDLGTGLSMPDTLVFSGRIDISLAGPCGCDPGDPAEVDGLCGAAYYDREKDEWSCRSGFQLIPDTAAVCEDVNECKTDVCGGGNERCVNLVGSYDCLCLSGYKRDDADACVDIDECDPASGVNACATDTCHNVDGSYECCAAVDEDDKCLCAEDGGECPVCPAGTVALDDSGLKCDTITAVSAGGDHTCVVSHTGRVFCWGWNGGYKVGVFPGSAEEVPARVDVPFEVRLPGPATFVEASEVDSCAVVDGEVTCWGEGEGVPSDVSSAGFWRVGLENVNTEVAEPLATNRASVCAIIGEGQEVACNSKQGEIKGSVTQKGREGYAFDRVELTGNDYGYAYRNGEWSWFDLDDNRALDFEAAQDPMLPEPDHTLPDIVDLRASSSAGMTCAIGTFNVAPCRDAEDPDCTATSEEGLACWSNWSFESFGPPAEMYVDGNLNDDGYLFAYPPQTDGAWKEILAVGNWSACVTDADGVPHCFGDTAMTKDVDPYTLRPVDKDLPSRAVPVSANNGIIHFLAALDRFDHGGALSTWVRKEDDWTRMIAGAGLQASVDQGAMPAPLLLSGDRLWVKASAGGQQTCAISDDQRLFCDGWYDSSFGVDVPGWGVEVEPQDGAVGWLEVGAGAQFACAIDTNGLLYCWGCDYDGVLGRPASESNDWYARCSNAPQVVLVDGAANYTASQLSVGSYQSCALVVPEGGGEGDLHCWGRAERGQIGVRVGKFTADVPDTCWWDGQCGASAHCAISAGGGRCFPGWRDELEALSGPIACDADAICGDGNHCDSGTCHSGAAGDSGSELNLSACTSDADCGSGNHCDDTRCYEGDKPLEKELRCMWDWHCGNDGYWCDEVQGTCHAKSTTVPVKMTHPSAGRFVKAFPGGNATCYVDDKEAAWCSGQSSALGIGEMLDGYGSYVPTPHQVIGPDDEPLTNVIGISTDPDGYRYCFQQRGGTVACAGEVPTFFDDGASGYWQFAGFNTRAEPLDLPGDVRSISVHYLSTCVLTVDGVALCRGELRHNEQALGLADYKALPGLWSHIEIAGDGVSGLMNGALYSVGDTWQSRPGYKAPVPFPCHLTGDQGEGHCEALDYLNCDPKTRLCTDRNECAESVDPCEDGETCANRYATFEYADGTGFTAKPGYVCLPTPDFTNASWVCEDARAEIDPSGACACKPGEAYRALGEMCDDANECVEDPEICGDGLCDNTPFSGVLGYQCECDDGFEFDPKKSTTCVDIDECAQGLDNCAPEATCTNGAGDFSCTCPEGTLDVNGDGSQCDSAQ